MNRVKRGVTAHKRHKKILKQASGYYGLRSKSFRVAKAAVHKALQYSYRDRKTKKRYFRSLWITRINGALKQYDMSYSVFMHKIKTAQVNINRKMLADIAMFNRESFQEIIKSL